MDPITHAMLTTLRIEEMLRERQPRHDPWHGGPSRVTASGSGWRRLGIGLHSELPVRLRRRLGALLIRVGRRLGDGARPPRYPLYGPAQR